MEWPRVKPRSSTPASPGVYVELDELIRLKYSARGFTLRPRQPVHSLLAGRKASRLRGRGLDFEELRGYLPGDDVRNIDWKATARMRKAQVRVYLEERDRPCLLLVDQRMCMFFGSREKLKSVAAAEAAALAAWRVLDAGDRIGAVVFSDTSLDVIRPLRSAGNVMRILNTVVEHNHRLRVDPERYEGAEMLNQALEHAAREAKHDALVVAISDFSGVDDTSRRLFTKIAAHNDTLAVHVSDPLERRLPEHARLAFQQRDRQIEVETSAKRLGEQFAGRFESRVERRRAFLRRLETPILDVDTVGSTAGQIRAQIGRAEGRAR